MRRGSSEHIDILNGRRGRWDSVLVHSVRRGQEEIQPGDIVWLPDRRTEATVQEEVGPQSFKVQSSDGSYRQNRRDLIRLPRICHSPVYRPYSMTSLNHEYELAHHEYTEQPPFWVPINGLWQYIRSIFLSCSSCRSCRFTKLVQPDNYLVPIILY